MAQNIIIFIEKQVKQEKPIFFSMWASKIITNIFHVENTKNKQKQPLKINSKQIVREIRRDISLHVPTKTKMKNPNEN